MKPMTCPNKHPLPREGCTPLYCGEAKALAFRKAKGPHGQELKDPLSHAEKNRKRVLVASPTLAGEQVRQADALAKVAADAAPATESDDKTASQLAKAVAKRAMRRNLVPVPEGLDGADAEEWAQKKAVQLLPDAAAELEYQLKYGDDSQRREAARDVLDMNGMRRRESGGNNAPTIILNLGNTKLPWEQKTDEKVVAGEATRSEAGKAQAS